MTKAKCPFKKFPLRPIKRDPHTPTPDKIEGTDVRERGYWPGSGFTPSELAFIKAVDDYRKRTRRKFLSAVDHLRIAAALGWLRLPAGLDRPHTGDASDA